MYGNVVADIPWHIKLSPKIKYYYPLRRAMTRIKRAFIMRGVSGSGKSTIAEMLAADDDAMIFSTDQYFMVDGKYVFDPTKLKENHAKNLQAWIDAVENELYATVVCDNTNTTDWELRLYRETAEDNGYQVIYVAIEPDFDKLDEYHARNTHGVPKEVIKAQMERLADELDPNIINE